MDITFVLAVLNKLNLTKECYYRLRKLYPNAPLVISSGGSTDGTKEWLLSLDDDYLTYVHNDDRINFSENYNTAINLVDTEKLVLIHNDMVIGSNFLENLSELLDENPNTLLSYTTIEPPIFKDHVRPGKVLLNLGDSFENFSYTQFESVVNEMNKKRTLYSGATFFMSGYKKMFIDVGGFDGYSFDPCFCEDDDFLIRTKLKGYELKTTECAVVYHFVSQTSRFSDDFRDIRERIEIDSNRNFVRKWGIPLYLFNDLEYWNDDNFIYNNTLKIGFTPKDINKLHSIEPFFDKIYFNPIPDACDGYIDTEQKHTKYDIRSKFLLTDIVDVMVYEKEFINEQDYDIITKLRLILPEYEPGRYEIGNLIIDIKKGR